MNFFLDAIQVLLQEANCPMISKEWASTLLQRSLWPSTSTRKGSVEYGESCH